MSNHPYETGFYFICPACGSMSAGIEEMKFSDADVQDGDIYHCDDCLAEIHIVVMTRDQYLRYANKSIEANDEE